MNPPSSPEWWNFHRKKVSQRGCYLRDITKALSCPMSQWHYSVSVRPFKPSLSYFSYFVYLISQNWTNHTYLAKRKRRQMTAVSSAVSKEYIPLREPDMSFQVPLVIRGTCIFSANTDISPHQVYVCFLKTYPFCTTWSLKGCLLLALVPSHHCWSWRKS